MILPTFSQRQTVLGRADLVSAWAEGQPELLNVVAQQLGLKFQPLEPEFEPVASGGDHTPQPSPQPQPDSAGYPQQIQDIALWMVTGYQSFVDNTDPPDGPAYLEWKHRPTTPAKYRSLAPWSQLEARLLESLTTGCPNGRVDVPRLVDMFARREVVSQIPRLETREWNDRIAIVQDRSLRLVPFEHDQKEVMHKLRELLSQEAVIDLFAGRHPRCLRMRGAQRRKITSEDRFDVPVRGSQIVVLGDLGVLSGSQPVIEEWYRWGRAMLRSGCRLTALVPCSLHRVPAKLREVYSLQSWQRKPTACIRNPVVRDQFVRQILTLAAPTLRLEPGLLRDLRNLIPVAAGDASLEVEIWQSGLLASNHPTAATLQPEFVEQVRSTFESEDSGLRQRALTCIRNWHANLVDAPEIWLFELLGLTDESRALAAKDISRNALASGSEQETGASVQRLIDQNAISAISPSQDLDDARAAVRHIVQRSQSGDHHQREAADAYLSRRTAFLPQPARNDRQVGKLLTDVRQRLHPDLSQSESFAFTLDDADVEFCEAEVNRFPRGQIVGSIRSTDRRIELIVRDVCRNDQFWKNGRPDFASDFGTDQYGAWFEFEYPKPTGGVVTQRMRWIPAGEFLMGSPTDEPGRWDIEGPQHFVTLSRGYWLAETTCTQELWTAVTEKNPSRFKGDQRPVERVSFEDAEQFLNQLNEAFPELKLGLPTEAQWEFACRAGTMTPYSTGHQITHEQANFEWHHETTVDCKAVSPNPWGLFQMHGNVWEWCSDWYGAYGAAAQEDPIGPESGSFRVLRGGSWGFNARYLRSALRSWYDPGIPYDGLGFRLLSSASAEPVQPAEEAEVPVAEQGSKRSSVGEADRILFVPFADTETDADSSISVKSKSRRILRTDVEQLELTRISKPEWARTFGQDRCGIFADFEVERTDKPPVRQRMRWIPPGRFQMGSPPDEPGRSDNELQHLVTLRSGFWMFDTPCTQELWLAVMEGDNPSRFPDNRRPVEQVSWQEATGFGIELSRKISLHFQLPTEAQWEYACRAETTTAIYSGPLEILGSANAPALDPIAWYGGNSGHDFDHSDPVDISEYSWLKEGQYEFDKAGTRRVAQKKANPFGLYDMLGNVWEWCSDCYGDYAVDDVVNPTGPATGLDRVLRGGSWYYDARGVRSARRNWSDPGYRYDDLGFRCSSSGSSPPNK